MLGVVDKQLPSSVLQTDNPLNVMNAETTSECATNGDGEKGTCSPTVCSSSKSSEGYETFDILEVAEATAAGNKTSGITTITKGASVSSAVGRLLNEINDPIRRKSKLFYL